MTDSVVVGSFTDGVDEVTGDPTRVPVEEHYAGPGRVRWGSREVAWSMSTGSPVGVQEPYLSVPFGSPLLPKGDEVLVTGSEDSLLVGRTFRVSGSAAAGQVTAYRYPLEEI